jgi:alginate O-acetyltransferase complex protein AlgI
MAATSLAEFWGARWNTAFAVSARRFVLRPLARRCEVRLAGLLVFLLSGLIHETVISLPARGGWGGPTSYFLLQAVGAGVERTAIGARAGLGRGLRGWAWTVGWTIAPLPLLFHGPFVRNVIVPFYRTLSALLP